MRLPSDPTAADLLALPLLHVDYGEPSWTDWPHFLAHHRTEAPEILEGLTFTSYVVCLDVAERGEGIAIGWQRTVQPRLDAGRLVRVPGLTMPLPNAINAYRPRASKPRTVVDELIALLKHECNVGPTERPEFSRQARGV
ncbi:MAG: LysR substrate-binding domain-containing protein [Acidimicrobiales bacterium]